MHVHDEDAYNALIATHNALCHGVFERMIHVDGKDYELNVYHCTICASVSSVSLARRRRTRHRDTFTIVWSDRYHVLASKVDK